MNNIFLINFFLIFFKNCKIFIFVKTIILALFFIEGFFFTPGFNTSLMHLIILKINSEFNLVILFIIVSLNFFKNEFFLKISFNFFIFMFLETLCSFSKTNSFLSNSLFIEPNPSLTNSLLIAHPIFLYYICACILILFYDNFFFNKYVFFFRLRNKFNAIFFLKLILSLMISIFLGAFWAEQELNWGGWWTWDLIEVISLCYFMYSILLLHLSWKLRVYNIIFVNILINFAIFTLLVKFNFISSVHNFVTINASFQFFFEISAFFILLGFFLLTFKSFKKKNYLNNQNVNILSYLFLLVSLWSYVYIIIEFLFIFTGHNLLLEAIFKDFKIILTLITIFFLIFYKGFIHINVLYLTFIEYIFNFLIRCKIIKFDFLHFSFFSFFILTNLIYFFLDPVIFEKNFSRFFYISNSNFFNCCYISYCTQNPYGSKLFFNNNDVFFKNLIIYENIFLEFFSSSNKFLINLNMFLLIKISILMQMCMYINFNSKKTFFY